MKTYHFNIDEKKVKVEVLTIDEARKKNRLTKEEAIDMHTWHKGVSAPVDNKHIVYGFNDHFLLLPNNPERDWVVLEHFDEDPSQEEVFSVLKLRITGSG